MNIFFAAGVRDRFFAQQASDVGLLLDAGDDQLEDDQPRRQPSRVETVGKTFRTPSREFRSRLKFGFNAIEVILFYRHRFRLLGVDLNNP